MAHFAQIVNGVVHQVIVVQNSVLDNKPFPESEQKGVDFCRSLFGTLTIWKQTSYNKSFRKNFAGVGFIYDTKMDAFIPPKPYSSWLLNEETYLWYPPIPYPLDENVYVWNEKDICWVKQ